MNRRNFIKQMDGCTAWALGWGIQGHSGGQTGFRSLVMACLEKRSGFAALRMETTVEELFTNCQEH